MHKTYQDQSNQDERKALRQNKSRRNRIENRYSAIELRNARFEWNGGNR